MKKYYTLCLLILAILPWGQSMVLAQAGWHRDGSLWQYEDLNIVSNTIGADETMNGSPVITVGRSLQRVDISAGNTESYDFPPEGNWIQLPRSPYFVLQVVHKREGDPSATFTFFNVKTSAMMDPITISASASTLEVDQNNTWISQTGSAGAVVLKPAAGIPVTESEYLVLLFKSDGSTQVRRIKPKVDIDIYVRDVNEEPFVYIRGNGLSFPPETEEVFTNGGYLIYDVNGDTRQLSLPTRGPGSGKGRHILWHSNKWDRLLIADEAASGCMLVKASNGLPTDTVEHSSQNPSAILKLLSASGNKSENWVVSYATIDSKPILLLWAMPALKEVTSYDLSQKDGAIPTLPCSKWNTVVPFIVTQANKHALYKWDPQDIVSVNESRMDESAKVNAYPAPARDVVTLSSATLRGQVAFTITSISGEVMQTGTSVVDNGVMSINTGMLPAGVYAILLHIAENPHQTARARIIINR